MPEPVLQYENPRDGRRRWTWYRAAAVAGVLALLIPVFVGGVSPLWPRPHRHVAARKPPLYWPVQSFRSQLALFKLQHNDRLPGSMPLIECGGPDSADEAILRAQLTQFTDVDGNTSPTKTATHIYGPYFSSMPVNALNRSQTIASAAAPGVGFVYDYAGGTGTGKVWGVDSNGKQIEQ
jgi:hypothetical protein